MFNPYELLKEQSDIFLGFEELPGKLRGLYHKDKEATIILLNKNLNIVERRCVLTEELAHHFLGHYTGFSCSTYFERLSCNKQEKDALRWAVNKLIPDNELKEFIEHNPEAEIWDLTEHFWVTEEMAIFKLELIKRERSA